MKITRRLHGRFFQQSLTCIMACWVFLNMPLSVAQATPTAAEVVAGSAAVVQADNTTNVQVVSNRAVINWDSLDTSYNETLNFLKESNFAVLNRVINGSPTRFDGSLFAENGSVFIVNTQGLVFGPTAYIQASQFVGSSLDITNTDFMNGQYAFAGGNGAVVNQGDITAQSVALIGKQVLNSGTITSPEGYVVMAAGDRVLLGKRGESIFVELDSAGVLEPMDTQISDVPADVTNEGLINAEGGTIVLAAGDSFSRAVANIGTLSTAAGKIKVDAARVENMGTINADAVEGNGGSISLTATEEVILGAGSLTSANAGANGDGGEIIAYSPRNALFHEGARVEAKGGDESGDGGFFELSGLEYVDVRGEIDLTSTGGRNGTFLIDPHNILIDNLGLEEGELDNDTTWKAYGSSQGYSHLDIGVLEGYLDNADVTISTDHGDHENHSNQSGWILFNAGRDLQDGTSGGSGNSFEVYAHDDILLESGINFTGDGSVSLNAGDEILSNASLHTGGDLEIRGNGIVLGGPVDVGGNLTIIGRDSHALIVLTGGDAWSRVISFDDDGELSEGNYGTSLNVEDIDITALTSIESGSSDTGTLYLDMGKGLGVQNLKPKGSKGISGSGGDQDEAIIFNFNIDDIPPESILIGFNEYELGDDKPVINLSLSTGDDFTFTTDHQNWDDAITYVGSSGAIIDLGILLGPLDNTFVNSLSVMETDDHFYLGSIDYSKQPVWGNVWAKSTLDAGGDIEISVTGDWRSNYYPGTITLEGDVTAGANIKLYNDTYTTNLTGNGVKLQAGQDIFLVNDNLGDTKSENCTFLQSQDKLAIIAGAGNGVTNGRIHADLTEISVTGSSLILEQDLDLNTANYLLGNQNNTYLTLISNEGSVTSTTGANAANKWESIGAYADENITLANDGDPKTIKLGESGTPGRSLWAENGYIDIDGFNVNNSPINPTGSVEAGTTLDINVDHDIDLGGDVTSGGDMGLHAGNDIIAHSKLTTTGTVGQGNMTLDAGDNITLGGAVQANGKLTLTADTDTLSGGDLHAHGTVKTSVGDIDADGVNLMFEDAVESKAGMNLNATGKLLANSTLTALVGDVELYADDAAGNRINLNGKVDASQDILLKNNTEVAAGQTLEAGRDVILADGKNINGAGALTLLANRDITLGGAVQAVDNLTLKAGEDIYAHGNLISNNGSIEIYSSDLTTHLGGDVTAAVNVLLNNNTKLNGSGDQTVDAGRTLTANGHVRKCTPGDMWLLARGTDDGGKSIDLSYNDGGPGISTYQGNLWILGAGNIQISGDVTTFGPDCSANNGTPCSGWETGGVAIVSQEGRIYTTGDADDTLNVSVTGNSDHELGLGIYNSSVEEDARAAIAIVSPEELKIGDGAKLEAFGRYYNDVDDRSAIAFLDTPDTEIPVGGLFAVRNEGDLFDLAIYVASLDSDVTVTAATSILSREPIEPEIPPLLGDDINGEREYECVPKGAMVIDAKTNVNLGGEFVTSLESEAVGGRAEIGDRLELVSRDTEWLNDATGRLPFASDFILPDGYAYVLRGAGLENLDIDDGRAWVLENMPVENAPLGQRLITTIQGCPALMKWAAEELGIDERRIYIWAEIALAFDMDIQPCDACARLKDTATILGDAEGTYIAALAMAVNQFASVNKPLSEEQMASIAEAISRPVGDDKYYATAGQWLDALGVYVEVLSTDFGWSLDEAVVLVTDKYVAPAIEGSDVNLAAFIAMRVASLGG